MQFYIAGTEKAANVREMACIPSTCLVSTVISNDCDWGAVMIWIYVDSSVQWNLKKLLLPTTMVKVWEKEKKNFYHNIED